MCTHEERRRATNEVKALRRHRYGEAAHDPLPNETITERDSIW